MSGMFSKPKQEPIVQADTGQADAQADRLRDRLARKEGRSGTVLTATKDSQAGAQRPRSTTLGGG